MFNFISFAVSTAFAIIPWFVPEIEIAIKIIITLSVFLVATIMCFIYSYIKYKQLSKEHKLLREKHKALAIQFKNRTQAWQEYKDFIFDLNYQLNSVIQNTSQERFNVLFDWYLTRKHHLNQIDIKGDPHDY